MKWILNEVDFRFFILWLVIRSLQFISMDLHLLKKFFSFVQSIQAKLEEQRKYFFDISAYALYKLIAQQSQPKIDHQLLKSFLNSFNPRLEIPSVDQFTSGQKFVPLYTISDESTLDHGIEVFIQSWGVNGELAYDHFAMFIKGKHELPDHKARQITFPQKKKLFEVLEMEIQALLEYEAFKKAVYHSYKNMTDLFETLTPTNILTETNLHNLYLMYGERKTDKYIQRIIQRIPLPCDFDTFLGLFKSVSTSKYKEKKIFYSSKRSKKEEQTPQRGYTTPRKEKYRELATTIQTKRDRIIEENEQELERREEKANSWQILGNILLEEEQFNNKKIKIIENPLFDLELVYQRHGKKFQAVLNQKYGSCNFSSFVRFIVPQTYEHRYLSFIRYAQSLPEEVNASIDDLLVSYEEKELKIEQFWKGIDKQIVFRQLCLPFQEAINSSKLEEFFTKREVKVLCDRLDPQNRGFITLEQFS